MMARTLAEAGQVLGLASRACCERQLWTVGNPDALGMAHEIEGAVEIDAGALVALFAVVLETADQRIRCRLVLKVAAGRSWNAAARELGCAPSTAVRIVARFHTEGEAALLDHRNENGLRKIDADVRGGVCEILTGSPEDHGFTRPTWTLEILRAVVETVLRVALNCAYAASADACH